jgi:hypothetical protein
MDIVKISDMPGRDFTTVIYGHDVNTVYGDRVKMVNYYPSYTIVRPSLSKNESLCHPISSNLWINIGPSDSFNKVIRDCIVGDLINFMPKDCVQPVQKIKKKR